MNSIQNTLPALFTFLNFVAEKYYLVSTFGTARPSAQSADVEIMNQLCDISAKSM